MMGLKEGQGTLRSSVRISGPHQDAKLFSVIAKFKCVSFDKRVNVKLKFDSSVAAATQLLN